MTLLKIKVPYTVFTISKWTRWWSLHFISDIVLELFPDSDLSPGSDCKDQRW